MSLWGSLGYDMKRTITILALLMIPAICLALGTNWVQVAMTLTNGQKYATVTGFTFSAAIETPFVSVGCVATSGPGSYLISAFPIINSFTTTNFLVELSMTTDTNGYTLSALIPDPTE